MQLLCGLYETEEGSVELYGQPITQINENDRYNEINALLQSQQIFDGTVRENLLSNQKDENLIDVLNMLNLLLKFEHSIDFRWNFFIWR